jgi:DNA-directed RNA polymerase subunit RPC12/RpoP
MHQIQSMTCLKCHSEMELTLDVRSVRCIRCKQTWTFEELARYRDDVPSDEKPTK